MAWLGFVGGALSGCGPLAGRRRCGRATCRRGRVARCADRDGVRADIVDAEDLEDDEDYVVVDGKDLDSLITELIDHGNDSFGGEWKEGAVAEVEETQEEVEGPDYLKEYSEAEERETTENLLDAYQNRVEEDAAFFTEENIQFLPRWMQDRFKDGSLEQFIAESERTNAGVKIAGSRSLDPTELSDDSGQIRSVRIEDLAQDYRLPIELVMSEMAKLGAKKPIDPGSTVGFCLDDPEVDKLVTLITTFDAVDLGEKYSDNMVEDLAFEYDVDPRFVSDICLNEEIELWVGDKTHLLKTDEETVIGYLEKVQQSR